MRTGQTKKLLVKWKELKLYVQQKKNIAIIATRYILFCYYIYYISVLFIYT